MVLHIFWCTKFLFGNRRIHRPHLGFKFFAIKLLDPLYIEKIWRKYNIDDGLIVNEVYNVYCFLL
jgi:hypothetical protein